MRPYTEDELQAFDEEWGEVGSALSDLYDQAPKALQSVLQNLVDFSPGYAMGFDNGPDAFGFSIVVQLRHAYQDDQAREAAEAWGVEVEWPDETKRTAILPKVIRPDGSYGS